jgi:hypothetical protein
VTDVPGFAALDFLAQIDDVELREEIRQLLAQLQILSEARAASLYSGPPSTEKPAGPPGFVGLSERQEPPKGRSLHEHFVWRFRDLVRREEPRRELWRLLWEAECDYKRRVIPPTEEELQERTALLGYRPTQNSKEEEAFAAHIIATTQGVHSYKVSLDLNLPQGWIEHQRELAQHDPVMGHPRPAWRKLSAEAKRELVAKQQQLGHTQTEAAQSLGCGERTVREYWPKEMAA